jgi:hypothetical protein
VNSVNVSPTRSDIQIGVLDSDVPGTIGFAKVLPLNWERYVPGLTSIPIPVLSTDQEKKAIITNMEIYPLRPSPSGTTICAHPHPNMTVCSSADTADLFIPTEEHRMALFESIISGDSGSPSFLVVNNQLVILTIWTGGTGVIAGSGSEISSFIPEIDSAMATLQGGGNPYQLSTVDLTGYTQYQY